MATAMFVMNACDRACHRYYTFHSGFGTLSDTETLAFSEKFESRRSASSSISIHLRWGLISFRWLRRYIELLRLTKTTQPPETILARTISIALEWSNLRRNQYSSASGTNGKDVMESATLPALPFISVLGCPTSPPSRCLFDYDEQHVLRNDPDDTAWKKRADKTSLDKFV